MLAFINARIITMAGIVLEKGTLFVEKGKIKKVCETKKVPIPKQYEIIDLEGDTLMPGLIDCHCHVGMMEEVHQIEGDDLNESSHPVTPMLRAIDAVYPGDLAFLDARKAGVTTIHTLPGSANVIGGTSIAMKTNGTVADHMVIKNPAGLKVAFGENPKRVYGEQSRMPKTRMAIAALLREQLVKAVAYEEKAKQSKPKGKDRPERDLAMEVLGLALRGEIPIRAHAHRSDDIMTAIRIAEEFQLQLVIEHGTEAHLISEELVKRNIPVATGPSFVSRAKVEMQNRTFETPGILARKGVLVAIMTDHPVIPIEYLSLCAALAVKAGMDTEEALKAITINPARILGIEDRVGSLEVGKDADLVVTNGDPLEVKTVVKRVFIEGKEVYHKEV